MKKLKNLKRIEPCLPSYGWLILGAPFSIIVLLWVFQGLPWVKDQSAQGAQAEALSNNSLGEIAMKEKRYQDAFNQFNRAIYIKSDYTEAYVNLGILYHLIARDARTKGDSAQVYQLEQQAVSTLKSATRFGAKKNEMIYNNLGMVYASLAQLDTAEAMFRRALEFGVNPAPIWRNIGELAMQRGHWEGAIEAYSNAIASRPTLTNMFVEMLKNAYYSPDNDDYAALVKEWLERGLDSTDFDRYDEQTVNQFLRTNEKTGGDYKDLALAWEKKGGIDEALRNYQTAVQYKPNWSAVFNRMGIICARRGEYDQAEKAFRRALAADPRDSGARENLEFLKKKLAGASAADN